MHLKVQYKMLSFKSWRQVCHIIVYVHWKASWQFYWTNDVLLCLSFIFWKFCCTASALHLFYWPSCKRLIDSAFMREQYSVTGACLSGSCTRTNLSCLWATAFVCSSGVHMKLEGNFVVNSTRTKSKCATDPVLWSPNGVILCETSSSFLFLNISVSRCICSR